MVADHGGDHDDGGGGDNDDGRQLAPARAGAGTWVYLGPGPGPGMPGIRPAGSACRFLAVPVARGSQVTPDRGEAGPPSLFFFAKLQADPDKSPNPIIS